jgi:hypothetical protein
MIYFAKPGLTEDLHILQKVELSVTCYMCDTYTWQKAKHVHKRQLIVSSERMLHNDYDRKGSFGEKKSLVLILEGFGAKADWLAVNRQS